MFQKKIVEKYLSKLDTKVLAEKYETFRAVFGNDKKIENIRQSKEEQYQEGFIRDLFVAVLGYTIKPEENYNILTELKNEVANKSNSKKADGAICEENDESKVRAVLELKGTDTTDLDKVAFQAFSYENFHNECNYVIVSNFERLRIYVETQIEFLEFNLFALDFQNFCLLYLLLEINQLKSDVPLKLKHETVSEEKQITDNFYADYSTFKRLLFEDLVENNPGTDKLLLFKKTQKLLDRILFILFCEDRNLLPPNSVAGIIKNYQDLKKMGFGQPLYEVFKNFFNRINSGYVDESDESKNVFAYNGGLFKADDVLDSIKVGDDVLFVHSRRLADYDFESQISVDILGRIFENSLTEIEEVQKELEGERVEERWTRDVSATPQHDTLSYCHSERSEESLGKIDTSHSFSVTENRITFTEMQDATNAKGFVYFMTNKTNSVLYIGVTGNLQKRIYEHRTHQMEGFTDKYNCEKLVYFECFGDIKDAIEREKYLKGKKRDFKNKLASSINPDWIDLYDYISATRDASHPFSVTGKGDVSATPQHDSNTLAAQHDTLSYCHSERSEESLGKRDTSHSFSVTGKGDVSVTPQHDSNTLAARHDTMENTLRNIGKRKKDGVFYTPEYITKYIVENTIGKICGEKKEELKIIDEDFSAQKKYTAAETKELEARLKSYRAWLLDLKICDPACGSGAFLNAALHELRKEHYLIDRLWQNLFPMELNFEVTDNTILENNLYGVDINADSVEITKLSLWLHTAKKNRKLTTLNDKIKCGNSLIGSRYEVGVGTRYEVLGTRNSTTHNLVTSTSATTYNPEPSTYFDWEKEFPEVFANGGGFDVVLGNPPYVARNLDQFTKDYINANYETAEYQVDLYVSFIERGIKLLKKDGYNSFIVPNSWLKNLMMENCRKFLLEKFNLTKIVTAKESVFADASVDTLIYIGTSSQKQNEKIGIFEIQKNEFIFKHNISKERISKNDKLIFDIEVNDAIIPIMEKMKTNVSKIKDLFDVCRGINPYDKYTGQSPEIIASRAYHADYKKDDTFEPELKGRHIDRYSENWDGKSFISYGDWLAAPREPKYFTGTRIVFREILGKTLITTVLTKDIKIDRSLYIALPLNETVDVYFVDGILNSPLMSFYFRYSNNEFDELFPKMRVAEFRELPIKNTTLENQQKISLLVKNIISLNESLQKKTQNFLKVVKQTFGLEKVSAKLENFYELDFDGFIKELKTKVSPKTKMEWLEVFEETQKELLGLKAQIEATDDQINSLVYELYGLTAEEIAVIENS